MKKNRLTLREVRVIFNLVEDAMNNLPSAQEYTELETLWAKLDKAIKQKENN